MVHALHEIHRVLKPGGALIDFRPVGASWPLVLESRGRSRQITMFQRKQAMRTDDDCDCALASAVAQGWFRFEQSRSLTTPVRCETAADLAGPLEIPDEVRASAQTQLDGVGPGARLAVHFHNVLALYRSQ